MRIAVVSLDNWGFNNYIVETLKSKGVETTSINFDDLTYQYPTVFHRVYNFFLKTLTKYNLKQLHLETQLRNKIKALPKQDQILVIKSDFLNKNILVELKKNSHKMITFLNDSLSRCPKMKKNIDLFEEVYSFENRDCKQYGFKKINNFIYTAIETNLNTNISYNVFNISSLDKRKKSVSLFSEYFNSRNISFKIILYSPKPTDVFNDKSIDIIHKPYSIVEMLEFLKKCKVVLDLQRPKQQGLSFRVFEALAYGKKLITLNKDIATYAFYSPDQIFIVEDINNIQIPDSFFTSESKPIDSVILQNYHVSNWVDTVFKL
ncbi:hypothetical protein [Cognatitamlana onchidii]|uniref:hypothetical protein n=1 Tax=Cognatitamlana onchidii TaxID=2562860 RepID=UPI0010A6367B|nr:hypothetical protein [Algibacter onchidii]